MPYYLVPAQLRNENFSPHLLQSMTMTWSPITLSVKVGIHPKRHNTRVRASVGALPTLDYRCQIRFALVEVVGVA